MLKSSCLFNKVRGNSTNQTEDVSLTFSTKIRSGLNVALLADRLTLVITLVFFLPSGPNMADSLKDGLSQHELPTTGHRRRTKK